MHAGRKLQIVDASVGQDTQNAAKTFIVQLIIRLFQHKIDRKMRPIIPAQAMFLQRAFRSNF